MITEIKKEREILVATPLPVSERDVLARIAATQERKIAPELRRIIRKHIAENKHLLGVY